MADIGGIINRLAPLIEKKVRREYNLLINAKTEARKLSDNLIEVQKVLEEAERRRLTDPRIRTWLERLQDVTYEIDDALDEWETLNLQLEIEEYSEEDEDDDDDDDDASHTWWEKVSIFIESLCSCSKHVFRRRDMALKIRELNEKVDLIGKETAKYTLLPISTDSQDLINSEITTSFDELLVLESQGHDKKKLVEAILNRGTQEPGDHIQVIPLVGMAGIGKTALTQLAFCDPDVQSNFELKSWVCVSHISDMVRVAKAILRSLGGSYPEDAELQRLLELIQLSVLGRKFLLVLDHLRIEDGSVLNQLKASLYYGAPGSRIIVTSRNENIAKLMGSTEMRRVKQLHEEDCWLLFSKIAFRGRKDMEKLRGIGRGIARKCKGLPLAAKTLGYYLQSKYRKELWEDVLEKEVWQLDEVAKALFAPLALSYNELPLTLKHCFSYCAIFPEDIWKSWIKADDLIRLWMVQGYLSSSTADTVMELKGQDYFEKLAVRSFFQYNKNLDENVKCRMHGILLDFAQYLTKTGSKAKKHRSFYSVDELSPNKLASLKSVRALMLGCKEMQELPLEIGNLIHLRFLELNRTSIKQLPATICNLYNLQILDLRYCKQLSRLPKRIHRLRNLRYLLIEGSDLRRLPRGIEKLTGLRTLDNFFVGRGWSKFGYLEKLNQLQGSISISITTLDKEGDADDAKKADLKSKIYISDLYLSFFEEVRMEVMEALQAPPNLKRFHISGYEGSQFPSWISTSLDKLRELQFTQCSQCLDLPPLGTLPFLEILGFVNMKSLKRVGSNFLGISSVRSSRAVTFPKLRELRFNDCDSWEEWEDITEDEVQRTLSIMPFLRKLELSKCPKLEGLPHLLLHKSIALHLEISHSSLLSQRYQQSPDRKFISHIQHVTFEG